MYVVISVVCNRSWRRNCCHNLVYIFTKIQLFFRYLRDPGVIILKIQKKLNLFWLKFTILPKFLVCLVTI